MRDLTRIFDALDELTPEELEEVARQAETLATTKREQRQRETISESEDRYDEQGDELPKSVPSKATLTKKTINDNDYWYWQWREGEKIRSKYKGPISEE